MEEEKKTEKIASNTLLTQLIQNLLSGEAETREKSLIALSTISLDGDVVMEFGLAKLSQALVGMLADPLINIRNIGLTAISHWIFKMEVQNIALTDELIKSGLMSAITSVLMTSAKELIEQGESLFTADKDKLEALLMAALDLSEIVCDLSSNVEKCMLEPEGGVVKISAEILDSGKVSMSLFNKLCSFLYSCCKASEKMSKFISTNFASLKKKLTSLLANKELSSDLELLAIVGGLIYTLEESLESLDPGIMDELFRVVRFIIADTKPAEEYQKHLVPIFSGGEGIKDPESEAKFNNSINTFLKMMNANSISLEIFSELFTTEEEEREGKDEEMEDEDLKMDYVEEEEVQYENKADKILDLKLLQAILEKSNKIGLEEEAIKLIKEGHNILRIQKKVRTNALGCLINIVVNRSKKLEGMEGGPAALAKFIQVALQEILSTQNLKPKQRFLHERSSTCLKIMMEKLGKSLPLPFVESDLGPLLEGILKEPNETIQINLIGTLGGILKIFPHSPEHNRSCCQLLLELAGKGRLLVTTAVLNAFFDIYSEETHNKTLEDLGVLSMFQSNIETYRSLLKSSRSKLDKGEQEFCQTTLLNLRRFIQYKKKFIK